ncbi:class I SAM-dependent methyltransferase [Patescibacteria group bacterium]|nr:class I SAM-dependent methyltransferase [Patescibacteria group bacterium]MBU2633386.1 class I SAM-dependent methyltransferase [Patescibacteria group bacterium]
MATDKKTIKSYDDYALKWQKRKRSGKNIAHKFLEKPAMYKKLPDLKGKSVLCVGCGTGEECEHLKSLDVEKIVGVDISKGLIELAKKSYPDLEFFVMDMENLDFPKNSFDLVYSSLTMHYVEDWTKTLKSIHEVLEDDGVFLFSTHHPVKWGAKTNRSEEKGSFLMGYEKYKDGRCEVFGDYLNTRKIDDIWFNEFNVTYYHRSLSEIIGDILKSGFRITDFIEPKPLVEVSKENENFYKIHDKIPLFMIFELKKESSCQRKTCRRF